FLQAFAYSGGFIFLGGASLIVFSADDGRTWNRGQAAALEKPVTCLAVSPGFSQDRVALAGTDGAGILRSTDGGRRWQYASFGLQDFSIMALAAVADWTDREVAFAATPTGLYRSPNGGRAWKAANRGLEGCIVLSIAPSPNFASDGVVFAGTVSDGIFRSCDGGITWQPCLVMPNSNDQIAAVNAFWLRPADDMYLAGLDDGQFLRSNDRGATWAPAADEPAAVLCFFGQEDRLYAGTADAGLLASDDSGRAWSADATLAARQFTSLFRSEGGGLFAAGADEGVWYSGDGGRCWANAGDFDSILLTAAVADDDCHTRLAGTASGLFRADDASPDWELVAPPPDVTALRFSRAFVEDRRVWAGTWSGDIFASEDGGRTWQPLQPPPGRAPIVALGVFHDSPASEPLVAVTFSPRAEILTVWRRSGGKWQIWLESPSSAPVGHVVDLPADSGELIVCLGDHGWHWKSGLWRCILKTDKPILRLLRLPSGGLVALTADSVLYSSDFADWTTVHQSPDGSFCDLALLPGDAARAEACVLTRGGGLVAGTIPE
ncbi:MAG: hypothetical protein U0521_30600, partial [Anaerolineae bacterium]